MIKARVKETSTMILVRSSPLSLAGERDARIIARRP